MSNFYVVELKYVWSVRQTQFKKEFTRFHFPTIISGISWKIHNLKVVDLSFCRKLWLAACTCSHWTPLMQHPFSKKSSQISSSMQL